MTPRVAVDHQDGVSLLTFQGRGPLNLLGRELFSALAEELDRIKGDGRTRSLVLQGAGDRAFSAGADLLEMRDLTTADAESFIGAIHQVARRLLTLPVPVVAAVHGPCLGGALELALACDLRIASEDARFGLPEVLVGVPSVIEASLLPRTIGLGRARAMLLTGNTINAQEALNSGLVDRVVPREVLAQEARDTARQFLRISPNVLAVQKDVVAKWLEMGEEEGAAYSMKAFSLCFATGHPQEAMTAFLDKREPRFD